MKDLISGSTIGSALDYNNDLAYQYGVPELGPASEHKTASGNGQVLEVPVYVLMPQTHDATVNTKHLSGQTVQNGLPSYRSVDIDTSWRTSIPFSL